MLDASRRHWRKDNVTGSEAVGTSGRTPYMGLIPDTQMHRQAIFESKGDKLSSVAECMLRTQGLWKRIYIRLNARWQTNWAIEDQAKNLNSIARPYDQQPFSPLDPTAGWISHLALAIYMFALVNCDSLAQANDFRIERRQAVFLCWMQGSDTGSLEPNLHQNECPLPNRLSYRGSS